MKTPLGNKDAREGFIRNKLLQQHSASILNKNFNHNITIISHVLKTKNESWHIEIHRYY